MPEGSEDRTRANTFLVGRMNLGSFSMSINLSTKRERKHVIDSRTFECRLMDLWSWTLRLRGAYSKQFFASPRVQLKLHQVIV